MIRLLIIILCCSTTLNAQVPISRCLTDELFARQIENPETQERVEEIEVSIQHWIKENRATGRGTISIPVVVHVVWKELAENICAEQIHSQIEVLNEDFNRRNNQSIVPEEFKDLMANVGIEFCLAKKNPEGLRTNGITRTQTDLEFVGEKSAIFYSAEGGRDAWDPARYLNIWLGNTHKELLGYAKMPGASIPAEDGVVINPKYFGRIGTAINSKPYHLGRVATHEIGHYLNLFHPWNRESGNCDSDDLVEDTPKQKNSYIGCPSQPQFSCGSMDMVVNFMDYVDDDCMAMFTNGQKLRMIATLENYRKGLIENEEANCNSRLLIRDSNFMDVKPNPVSHYLNVSFGLAESEMESTLTLFDLSGRKIQVWSNPENDFTFCVSEFTNGIYSLVLSTNQTFLSKKIVILH